MSITAVPLKPVKRRVVVYIWIGIVLAVLAAAALAFQTPVDPNATFLARNAKTAGVKQTPSGLQYKVLTPGKGATPTDEDVALVQYEGKLTDGTVFDQSNPQQGFPVPLGEKAVVPGFEEAVKLIPVGGKYRVWIPARLGYGPRTTGPIPANSVLVFDLEMVDFKSKVWLRQMQAQQQMMQQGGAMPPGAGGLPPGTVPPPTGEAPSAGH